jgi:hypothetical protein
LTYAALERAYNRPSVRYSLSPVKIIQGQVIQGLENIQVNVLIRFAKIHKIAVITCNKCGHLVADALGKIVFDKVFRAGKAFYAFFRLPRQMVQNARIQVTQNLVFFRTVQIPGIVCRFFQRVRRGPVIAAGQLVVFTE